MKILFAGASGVIGRNTVPLLVGANHEVLGLTRNAENVRLIESLGAMAVECDVYDLEKLKGVVQKFKPEIIINELTDLPDDPKHIPEHQATTSRVRTEGTANLITANESIKAKLISQSTAWEIPGNGGFAITQLEKLTLDEGGVVLRYGQIYGPGTYYDKSEPEPPKVSIGIVAQATANSLILPNGTYEVTDARVLKSLKD